MLKFASSDPSNKELHKIFFKKTDKEHHWKCRCGTLRKQNISCGYNNLIQHIKSSHPDYKEVFNRYIVAERENSLLSTSGSTSGTENGDDIAQIRTKQATLDNIFLDAKSINVMKWIEWIVMDGLPLSFCEKELTRSNTKLERICTKTLKKYMLLLVEEVEKKITSKVNAAGKYSLQFDG
jgi:hypothetical protein